MASIRTSSSTTYDPSWTETVEIDFTGLGTVDVKTAGTLAAGGATWTLTNGTNLSSADADATDGLHWVHSADAVAYIGATIADMLTGWDGTGLLEVYLALGDTTLDSNYQRFGVRITGAGTTGESWVNVVRIHSANDSDSEIATRYDGGSTVASIEAVSGAIRQIAVRIQGSSVEVRYSTTAYSGTWATWSAMTAMPQGNCSVAMPPATPTTTFSEAHPWSAADTIDLRTNPSGGGLTPEYKYTAMRLRRQGVPS
jgi:hypothetical protein